MRRAGVLMPIFSLPSPYGIGTLGKEAYAFVDFLKKSGQSLWQILPLGPTGYGDSPYQSFSSFAGNPYFIDLPTLIKQGLLTKEECDACDFGSNPKDIDYEKLYFARFDLLQKAYKRFCQAGMNRTFGYLAFLRKEASWLDNYSLFMAVKDSFGGVNFMEWDEPIRLRKKKAVAAYKEKLSSEIGFYQFIQFLFATQWMELKKYANKNGIEIVGDIPIYVAFDSADTWANPELFQLDEDGYPTAVAGCPPDVFTAEGQLWGNPLYNWKYHKKTGFEWWVRRMQHCFELYDVVRIDHFRGFDEYWSVPYGDKNAIGGKWKKGPGYKLFATLKEELGERAIIAEDLGFITDSVRKMIAKTGYPGMKILEFGLEAGGESEHDPHNVSKNYVVYTGTHDNLTIKSWVAQLPAKNRKYAMEYLQVQDKKDLPAAIVRAAMATNADTCIIPIADYIGLGKDARINEPSTLGCNWRWRLDFKYLTPELSKYIKGLTQTYRRLPAKDTFDVSKETKKDTKDE